MLRTVLLAIFVVFAFMPEAMAEGKAVGIPNPQWKKGERYQMTAWQRRASFDRGLLAYRNSVQRTWGVQVVQGDEEGDTIVRMVQLGAKTDMDLGKGSNKFRLKKKEFKSIMDLVEGLKSGFPMVISYNKGSAGSVVMNGAEIEQRVKANLAALRKARFVDPRIPAGTERFIGTILEREMSSAAKVVFNADSHMTRLIQFRRSGMVPKRKYTGISLEVPFLGLGTTAEIVKQQGQDVQIRSYKVLGDANMKELGEESLGFLKGLRKEYPSKAYEIIGRIDRNHIVAWEKGIPKAYSERQTLQIYTKTKPKTRVGEVLIMETTVKLQRN